MAQNDPTTVLLGKFQGFLQEYSNSDTKVSAPYINDNGAEQVDVALKDPNGRHTAIQGVRALRRFAHLGEHGLRKHAAGLVADMTGRDFEAVAPEFFDELAERAGEVSKVLKDAGHET